MIVVVGGVAAADDGDSGGGCGDGNVDDAGGYGNNNTEAWPGMTKLSKCLGVARQAGEQNQNLDQSELSIIPRGVGGGARTRDRRIPADFKAD
ncbi:hypothetical protein PoB_002201300 [Plakobranchus ocellatus]|uniref:Uncharacterized protein n=1 Tax=Plakobranchus ocellatus TaxID=259542 RepID=A0AAV3ZKY5_9GAST|nr:hypothetical protein PoB_002201300 [Plakobranchus ocellatus]